MANSKLASKYQKNLSKKSTIPKKETLKDLPKDNSEKKLGGVRFSCIAYDTLHAARAIGVSEAMLRKMRSEGTGPRYSKVGTKVVYLLSELKNFLHKNIVDGEL